MTAPRSGARPGEGAAGGRDRILDAATEVFAEKGFGETRVDEIAARAGVNKAMLYYHVGGEEALYAAVAWPGGSPEPPRPRSASAPSSRASAAPGPRPRTSPG